MSLIKRSLALLLCLLLCLSLFPARAFAEGETIPIDEAHFPDANFRSYVTRYDKDSDTALSEDEIAAVEEIICPGQGIASLQGIEYFPELTYLDCRFNLLTTLDMGKNPALRALECGPNQLKELDVSRNTELKTLSCKNNQLTSLDVSKNTALEWLWCYGNSIEALDLQACQLLLEAAKGEPVTDVMYGEDILFYEVDGNRRLAVNRDTKLVTGDEPEQPGEGIPIDEAHFPDANFRSYVTQFDTDSDGLLSDAEIAAVKEILCAEKDITSLQGIEVFTALKGLDCSDNQLTELDVSKNTAIWYLHCRNNQLTELDVSRNKALEWIWCSGNQLTSLDLNQNKALDSLYCSGNQLTTLDVSQNTKLIELWCNDNQLTALDVSQNTALTDLDCSDNQLTALDVSRNTALVRLECYNNQLTSLDVSNNTELTELWCYDNQLTALDVSKNTALERLWCYGNSIKALDLQDCPSLLEAAKGEAVTNEDYGEDVLFYGPYQPYEGWDYVEYRLAVDRGTKLITDEGEEPVTTPGDANGDGKVNGKDAIMLAQFLAGWDVTVDTDVMDVNKDGKVNGKDAIMLAQFLAGWDVTLG